MNKRHVLNPYWLACLAMLSIDTCAADAAADPWVLKLTPLFSYVGYGGSPLRSDMVSTGAYLAADYRDRLSLVGGATYTRLNYKAGIAAINQADEYLSARLHLNPDVLPGRLSLRLDGHQINNNDSTNESNDVQVVAPQVSFLSRAQSLYLDLGYAASFYGKSNSGNGPLTVQQWTPTLGLGFNENADWLQLRLYDVSASNTARAMRGHTDAVELKLTHYFAPQAVWLPRWVSVGGLAGNRMYAVDGDTAVVYNLADEQKGGGFVAAQWQLAAHYKATLSTGYDVYQTRDTGTGNRYTYSGAHMYLGVTAQW